MNARATFAIATRVGTVAELVHDLPEPDGRLACICRPVGAGLVIGSSQSSDDVDEPACARGGYEVVRRRSGGGAVVVAPVAQVWLDVFLPSGDPLYEHDVGRAPHWVGELWSAALRDAVGPQAALEVHRGPNVSTELSRRACFAGLGNGEVRLGGRKVVGLSQRRTRAGAWFFTMAMLSSGHVALVDLLRLAPPAREQLRAVLTSEVAVLDTDAALLERALLETLGEIGA